MKTLFTLLTIIFFLGNAHAQLILQNIKAVVISLDDDGNKLNNQIQLGDTIFGTLSYSQNAVDTNADTSIGDYYYSTLPFGFAFTAPGNITFQTDINNVSFLCEAINLPQVDGGDAITFRSYNNYYSVGNAAVDKIISWTVDDADGSNLSSDAIPMIVNLSVWDQLYGLTIGADDFPDGSLGFFIRTTVVKIEGDEGTGVSNIVSGNEERIFPNPVHSFFTISNPDAESMLVIEDVNGKVMLTERSVPPSIDVSHLPAGLYVVKVVGKKEVEFFRMIKD